MMMILGVALWMFPRPAKEDRHFDPRLAEIAYWLIALGTGSRVLGELSRPLSGAAALRWIVVLGGAAQAAGLALFFWTMWTRIRGRPDGETARS
jgi:hypothetical protein